MDFKKIIKRGFILSVCIALISLVGMGLVDFFTFCVLALLVIIAAGVCTLVHNQRIDKE